MRHEPAKVSNPELSVVIPIFNEEESVSLLVDGLLSALDEMHRVLKPVGRLFLSTPFILPIHDAPYDFYRYTQFGLAHLCRGFQHVKIRPRNDYLASVVVLMMRSVQVSGARRQLASGAIIAMALVLYPFARLLALIYQSDLATTGYVVSAVRGSVP